MDQLDKLHSTTSGQFILGVWSGNNCLVSSRIWSTGCRSFIPQGHLVGGNKSVVLGSDRKVRVCWNIG